MSTLDLLTDALGGIMQTKGARLSVQQESCEVQVRALWFEHFLKLQISWLDLRSSKVGWMQAGMSIVRVRL